MSTLLFRERNSGEIKVLNIKDKAPEWLENMWEFLCNLPVRMDFKDFSKTPTHKRSIIN